MSQEAVVSALASDGDRGLSGAEAANRAGRLGRNALPEPPRRSLLAVLVHQFKSPLIYLLLGAALVAVAIGEPSDGAVIVSVVLLNALIGALQEGRAEHAMVALRRATGLKATVIREGNPRVIDAGDVVPGDILVLSAGDAVAADARLLDGAAVSTAEAALTGESVPVAKDFSPVDVDAPLADRRSMVHAGTHVTGGRARAVVVATALATELGHIASLAGAAAPPPTPLERRVARFGRQVMVLAAALFAAILVVGLWRDVPPGQVFMIGISQVVGIIPEGLPVAMTIALAVGVQRMARRGAIVRRLSAVETLGATTVICSDKTGTLTRNEMTVTAVLLPGRRDVEVEGIGYAPTGSFREGGRALVLDEEAELRALLVAAMLCNDAQIAGPFETGSRWRAIGDPTEAALITAGLKAGLVPDEVGRRWPRVAELPFDAAAKLMATQHRGEGESLVVVKGAPEAVLDLCGSVAVPDGARPLDRASRQAMIEGAERMADRALRVLAIARVSDVPVDGDLGFAGLHGRCTLLGLVGQIDPPRAEAAVAVSRCQAAGIRPVMVTGDHKATAVAVARTLGMLRPGDVAMDGPELERITDPDLDARIATIGVFARVHPAQKLRIVTAFQRAGEVVAMTGDGVNDAPALVRADVGVAMGVTGTEVAKEAAKMVVTDDDFATIVAAVEEGRVVHRNIKKAVLFLLATSLAEVLVLLVAMLLGYPAPFAAVQILWNNLVTEGVITINLVLDPADGREMRRPPVNPGEPLVAASMVGRLLVMTPAIVLATLGWYIVRLRAGVPVATAQSEAFTLLVVCEWFNVLGCRSETRSALTMDVFRNVWLLGGLLVGNLLHVAVIFVPAMNRIFHTTPIGLAQVVAIGAVGSLVLWAEELRKLAARRGAAPRVLGA